MKITFTTDSIMSDKLDGSNGAEHWDTYHLIQESLRRGHDVNVVQTEDAIGKGGFSREIKLKEGLKFSPGFTSPDVFFTRGYGMRVGKDCFDNFANTLSCIESNIPLMINSAEATFFSRKDKQKKLPLPFIPYYEIKGVGDVTALLKEHKDGIILKPVYGLQGNGVEYVKDIRGLENLLKKGIMSEEDLEKDYMVEQFVPDQKEIRHVYLFGERAGSRVAEKIGAPGKEVLGNRYLLETPNKKHLEISKKAMELTGMQYGCVDFRGDYVLEINGSGAQTFYRDKLGAAGNIFLDLTPKIIDNLESKFQKRS